MKVVVIGGSSFSTPNLFRFLGNQVMCPKLDFVLVGRSLEHLDAVASFSRKLLSDIPQVSINTSLYTNEALSRELVDADIILIQYRIGGMSGRILDESFPLKFDIPGDEGLGPSGLSAAWRNWPELKFTLDLINRVSPKALILLLTSPIGILSNLCHKVFPMLNVMGVCELPWRNLESICNTIGVSVSKTQFEYLGVNHVGWFYQVKTEATDVVSEFTYTLQDDTFPTKSLIRTMSGIPTDYLSLVYDKVNIVKNQKIKPPRGKTLRDIQQNSFTAFQAGSFLDSLNMLKVRPTPWYDYAVGPLLLDLAGQQQTQSYFLTTSNKDLLPEWNPESVLEIPYKVIQRKLVPITPQFPAPNAITVSIRHYVEYEQKAASAILEGTFTSLVEALKTHPWETVPQYAEQLVRTILKSSNHKII